MIPASYAQWHRCITVDCGIALTPEYIAQRLHVLRDDSLEETVRFRRLYGDPHWQAVCAWFEQAASAR